MGVEGCVSGQEIGKISEAGVYQYLGIRLGSGKIFVHQKSRSIRGLLGLAGAFAAKSRCILREVGAMERLWLQVIKPHALY